jgi:L-aspartate oxidase
MAVAEETDFVIVGAGIAGLRAAIGLAADGARVLHPSEQARRGPRVLVVTKEALDESNTYYAQGGIAVAMSGEEDVALHLDDTVNAGDGLVNREAARVLVEEGPLRVEELLRWGTDFDREAGKLMLTREGAHSRNRILHAHGDATGAEIGRSLLRHARAMPNITLREWTTTCEFSLRDGVLPRVGLLTLDNLGYNVDARAVLLASGGAGQVYSDTTNPAVATGDGIAMAWRAGAEIADMEFYQFHPTALSLPGVQRFLLSEALRGEGAYLRNAREERFMERYHPLLELAPRDVVARAITREGMGPGGEALPVYLDMRHVKKIDPVSGDFEVPGGAWAGATTRPDPGAACGALSDGWSEDRCAWTHVASAAVRSGRGGLHRRARGEPAGQQFVAGGAGIWGKGSRGDGRRNADSPSQSDRALDLRAQSR